MHSFTLTLASRPVASRVAAQVCYYQPGVGVASELVHSKLHSRKWPAAAKIEKALRSFCRTVILRPMMATDAGNEIPITPIPKSLRVLVGCTEPSCAELVTETIAVDALPNGPRTLAGTPWVGSGGSGGSVSAAKARASCPIHLSPIRPWRGPMAQPRHRRMPSSPSR